MNLNFVYSNKGEPILRRKDCIFYVVKTVYLKLIFFLKNRTVYFQRWTVYFPLTTVYLSSRPYVFRQDRIFRQDRFFQGPYI